LLAQALGQEQARGPSPAVQHQFVEATHFAGRLPGQSLQDTDQHRRQDLGPGRTQDLLGAQIPGHPAGDDRGARLPVRAPGMAVFQTKPEKVVGPERQHVGLGTDDGKARAAEHVHRGEPGQVAQFELGHLGMAGEVDHGQEPIVAVGPHQGQDLGVLPGHEAQIAPAQGRLGLVGGEQPARPPEKRGLVALQGLHVDQLVVVFRIDDDREKKRLGIGRGKAGIAVRAPLHGRAHAVAVAEVIVVAHAELVAVIEDGRARKRQEQDVYQFHLAPVVLHQRRQPTTDAQVDAGLGVPGIGPVHGVALLVADHLQRQFVVIAQEKRPLAGLRYGRGLLQDVDDGIAVLGPQGHEDAGHDGEVEGHVALVAPTEIIDRVLGPLVGFGEKHPVREIGIDMGPQLPQKVVGLGQVLTVGAHPFVEIGHGVQAQAVDPKAQPEIHHLEHGLLHGRIVVVEVGLVGVEAVPVVGLGHRVPGPVGLLEILEDDPRLPILVRGVVPDVEIAVHGAGLGLSGALEPGMQVGGVVEDQLGDDPKPPLVGFAQKPSKIGQGAVGRMDAGVVGDVVAVVAKRRGIKRLQPQRPDPEPLQIIQPRNKTLEIAHAVPVAIGEGTHVQLIENGFLVPHTVTGAGAVPGPLRNPDRSGVRSRQGKTEGDGAVGCMTRRGGRPVASNRGSGDSAQGDHAQTPCA